MQESGVKGQTFMSTDIINMFRSNCGVVNIHNFMCPQCEKHNLRTCASKFQLIAGRVVILCVARKIPLLYPCINDQEFQ